VVKSLLRGNTAVEGDRPGSDGVGAAPAAEAANVVFVRKNLVSEGVAALMLLLKTAVIFVSIETAGKSDAVTASRAVGRLVSATAPVVKAQT
jgi:hypothetical protein